MKLVYAIALVAMVPAMRLLAVPGDVLAISSASGAFNIKTTPCAVLSAAELQSFPLHVTWRTGETVEVVSRSGERRTLATASLSNGSAALSDFIDKGGIWTLSNSASGMAKLGVSWNVFGETGGTVASGMAAGTYFIESKKPGPDRRMYTAEVRAMAYSGDSWHGNASAESTLTVVSPAAVSSVTPCTGEGVVTFAPGTEVGAWTVTLTCADGSLVSRIFVRSGGFSMTIR